MEEQTYKLTGNISKATDEELAGLKLMPDNQLLRMSQSQDIFAVVESMRRLKEALHKEEKAIKWLTIALVVFTVILVALAVVALRR
jgi:hypothetical protein